MKTLDENKKRKHINSVVSQKQMASGGGTFKLERASDWTKTPS